MDGMEIYIYAYVPVLRLVFNVITSQGRRSFYKSNLFGIHLSLGIIMDSEDLILDRAFR